MLPALEQRTEAEGRDFWTPNQVAALLSLHPSTVIRMFQDEKGVLKLNRKRLSRGRPHVTLRIPNALLQRKLRELGL
jgi:hypothetical protein